MTTRHRKRIREAVVALEARRTALKSGEARLHEAGRVLSAANEELLRTALANIENVLAALGEPAADESAEAKEARNKTIALAEAYSQSANDAGTGAWLISALLDLMSDESDEPGDIAILQGAFTLLVQWLMGEVAEIGTVDDDQEEPVPMYWWESTRDRLKATGGSVKPPTGMLRLREGQRLVTDLVPLREASVREDGSTGIKLIAPGWGSTGYYSPEVLEAGAEVFPAGTKMFWDHPTMSEEWERPERSLRDLAAELTTDAVWNPAGPEGAGLYAEAKVFSPYREVLDEIAPSIGVSIIAYGKVEDGTAEGKSGPLITELVAADSVDFVTYPGAGGQVLQLMESARQRLENPIQPKEATGTMEVEKDPKFLEAVAARTAAEQRAARSEERLVLREAKDILASKLAESTLPEITRKRLETTLAAGIPTPVKDGALDVPAFEKQIKEAIDAEVEYLANLTKTGQIRGMGPSGGSEGVKDGELAAAFQGLGMSEAAAKRAAAGR